MREAWKNFKLCVLAAACVLLLGVGVSTEASEPAPAQVQKLEQIGGNISSVKISWNAVIEDNIRYKVELSETIRKRPLPVFRQAKIITCECLHLITKLMFMASRPKH